MMMSGERRGARRGMTVLGKIPAVPKPINLPSQRLENRGLDPNVELVPKGSLSWGSGRSPPTTNSSWANAPSSSPPVSTGAWGNIAAKPVTNSGAAWSTGTSRPSSAGGLRPSSAGGTRPSSAGGTRPSSAGSVLTPDSATGLGAWGPPTSRPSSASGALGIAQSEPVITRPKSAETRMANTRFSTEGSASGPAWETGSRKLIEDSHQATRFTLTTGDFPSLGSEKVQNLRPQQKDQMGVPDEKVHAYEERTSSAQSASYAYDDMPPQPSDGYGYQFDRRGKDNWIRENPSFRGPCPVPEGTWYRDGHATTPIHAVHPPSCDTWHRDSESNGPDDHWHRVGPSNGPYAPSGPRYPHEPVGFVHQQGFPGPGPYGRGSHGSAGEGYGPFMRPGVMLPERPVPPFAPSMYPGPYDYYGYPGVPRPGYHSLDEREMMLGMTGVPGKYNTFPHQRPHETFNGYPHTGVGSRPPQNMPGLVRERSETIGHDESSFESSRESLQCREVDVSKEAAGKMDNHYRQPSNKDQSSVKRISSEPRRNSGAMFPRPQFGHRDWGAVAANDEPMDFSRPVFENEMHPVLISAKGNMSHGLSEGRTATSNSSKQNAEETDMNRSNKLSERENNAVANSTSSRDKEALSNEVLEDGGLSCTMTSKELSIIAEEKKEEGKIEAAKEKAQVNLDETNMKVEAGANHSPDVVAECSDLVAECSDLKSTQPRQRSRHHNKKIRSKIDSVANSVDQIDCENIPEKAEHLSNQSREVLEPSKLSENVETKASATAFVAENPISHLKGESSNSSSSTGDKIFVDNIAKQTGERHNKKVQRKPYPAKRAGRDHGLQDVRVVDKGHAGEGMVWAPVRMAMLKHEDAIAEKDDSGNVPLSKVKRPEMERYSPKPVTAHPGLCETVSKHAAEEEGGLMPPSTEQSQHGLSKSASPQPGHQVSVSKTVTGQHEQKELGQKETMSKHVPGQQQQEVTLGIRRMHQPKPTANKTARAFQRHMAHEHAVPSEGVQVQEKFTNGPQPRSPVWQQARKQQPHNTNEEISQDVRVADRVHGGEGMIWAPVRAASKTTEATFTADANEKKDDGDTGHQQCKTKRPEIERYTPKAVIAQGQQDGHKAMGTQLAQQDNMSPGQRMPKPSAPKSSKQYHRHAVHEIAVALPDRVQTPPEKFVSGLQSKSPVWQQARKQASHADDDMTQKVSHQQEAPRRVQPVHRQQGFINPNTNEKEKHKDVGSTLQTLESVREEKKGSHSDKNQKGQFDSDKHENISGRGLQSVNSKVESQKHSFGEAPKLHSRLQYQPVGNSGQQQSSASSNVQSRSDGGHNFVQGNTHWEQKRDHGHQRRKYNGRVTARAMDLERREHVTKSRMVIDATGGAVPGQVAT